MPAPAPTADEFRAELEDLLAEASNEGLPHLDVRSGDLHERMGGYPGQDHRMPTCCSVMRQMMRLGDVVLEEPQKGAGANVVIRYKLPR